MPVIVALGAKADAIPRVPKEQKLGKKEKALIEAEAATIATAG